MRSLIVGDLHTKHHILEKVKELSKNYDKIIFLGDYVDDWDTVPEASYNILVRLKEFYEQNLGKVVLLTGNHTASEWWGGDFRCSGWNPVTSQYVGNFMTKFNSIFNLAYAQDNFLFTHAGVIQLWADKYLDLEEYNAETIAKKLNFIFHHWGEDDEAEKIFKGLTDVGYYRGGNATCPSPLWTDINELLTDPLTGVNQIVGHTPVHTVLHYNVKGNDLYFCDTHSLFSNHSPIGDSSLLEIVDGKVRKISLDGKELAW